MNQSMGEKYSRMIVVLGFVPMFCVAPEVAAEIFKCTAKNGLALYQNFPCEFDSIGWAPPIPRVANVPPPRPDSGQPTAQAAPR